MNKKELISYLDEYLKINSFEDRSKNGLQVDNQKEEIFKIGYSVDATSYIFERAHQEKVDMVLCHHGLFWGQEEVITWVVFKRIQTLIQNDIALLAYHLPLDAHSEVGNNIGLLKAFVRMFDLQDYEIECFWEYHGQTIGYGIRFKEDIHIDNLIVPFAEQIGLEKTLYNFWKKEFIHSLAFVSGAGGDDIKEASEKDYDAFLTGEAKHSEICLAKELSLSLFIGWHRETETIWPKLLAEYLKEKFGLEIVFLDEKY
jgi:dinuclear metal center YbgI/SA1388 family protein